MLEHEKGLLYEPPPPVPQAFWDEFNKIVPLCPNNRDRYLKFCWGMDEREYVAGQWILRYGDTENDPPKYIGKARWILTGWQSPDVYDKREWLENKHLLGEWPSSGVFDFIEIHETPDGEYAPLDNTALDRCRSWAFWRTKDRKRSIDQLMKAKLARWELQEQIRKEAAAVVAQQFGEDIVKALDDFTNPVSTSAPSLNGGFKKTDGGILVRN